MNTDGSGNNGRGMVENLFHNHDHANCSACQETLRQLKFYQDNIKCHTKVAADMIQNVTSIQQNNMYQMSEVRNLVEQIEACKQYILQLENTIESFKLT